MGVRQKSAVLAKRSLGFVLSLFANPVIRSMYLRGTDTVSDGEQKASLKSTAAKCIFLLICSHMFSLSIVALINLSVPCCISFDSLQIIGAATGVLALAAGISGVSRPRKSLFFVIIFALLQLLSAQIYSEYDFQRGSGLSTIYIVSAYYSSLSCLLLFRFTRLVDCSLWRVIPVSCICSLLSVALVTWLISDTFLMYLPDLKPDTLMITFIICLIASINISLDFKCFNLMSKRGVPKYYEYYFCLALLFTLLWMLLEIITVLSVMFRRWFAAGEKN